MIKNFVFDLYGTLADISTNEQDDSFCKKMALFYGRNNAPYERTVWKREFDMCLEECKGIMLNNTDAYYDEEQGVYIEPSIDEVFKMLYMIKGIKADGALIKATAEVYRTMSTNYIKLYPNVKNLLTALRENGYKVYLLTNAQKSFTLPELRYLGIHNMFEDIVISSEVGRRKPDIQMFDTLIKKNNLEPSECIMVGNDYESDIVGAENAGMQTCYVKSNLSPKEDERKEIKADMVVDTANLFNIAKLFL